jgi:uracil-DNA glycosylase
VHSEHGLAKTGSGLISQDNDDQTAENMWHARKAAGIAYRDVCSWNVVPWYVGEATRNATPTVYELRRALPFLSELLGLLPRLVVVVPMGRVAQRQWYTHLARHPSDIVTVPAFHPSPRSLASPRHREALARSLGQVAAVLASAG